jgi:hypothetical protein
MQGRLTSAQVKPATTFDEAPSTISAPATRIGSSGATPKKCRADHLIREKELHQIDAEEKSKISRRCIHDRETSEPDGGHGQEEWTRAALW